MNSSDRFRHIIRFLKRHGLFCLMIVGILGLSVLWVWPRRGLIGKYYDNLDPEAEPAFIQQDKTMTLDAVIQRQDSFPQQEFRVVWDGWIMIDKDGEYTFSTISDDGSSIMLDTTTLLVDNRGFHATRKQSGTIFLEKGLHAIQVNFFQGGEVYDLRVYWQKPGKQERPIPYYRLYPDPIPIRGLGILLRNLPLFYLLSWAGLISIVIGRRLLRAKDNLSGVAKQYAQNMTLMVMTVLLFALVAELVMRAGVAIQEKRRDVNLLL